jgi:hypothetical protein
LQKRGADVDASAALIAAEVERQVRDGHNEVDAEVATLEPDEDGATPLEREDVEAILRATTAGERDAVALRRDEARLANAERLLLEFEHDGGGRGGRGEQQQNEGEGRGVMLP